MSSFKKSRVVIPVNQVLVCQRMLKTGQYQTRTIGFAEDKWLLKYLFDKGKTKEEIYQIWLPIFSSKDRNKDSIADAEYIFEFLWKRVCKIKKLLTCKRIYFYQEEIDLINAMDSPLQVKQMALLLLSYAKARGKYWYDQGAFEAVLYALKRYTTEKRQVRGEKSYLGYLVRAGLVAHHSEEKEDEYHGGEKEVDLWEIVFARVSGDVVFSVDTPLDVVQYFEQLRNQRTCPVCGKAYEYTQMHKTELCPACQRKKRVNRIVEYRKNIETPRNGQ